MKTTLFAAAIAACFFAGFVAVGQGDATAERALADQLPAAEVAQDTEPTCQPDVGSTELAGEPVPFGKKCSFDSDCSHGKCKKGTCGGCSFNSDCKGWGKCGKGQCGTCNFDSECKGFGKCSNGKCTKSPYK